MVDAGIELVEHPGGLDPLQQRAGARDQVVIVEQRAQALLALVGGEHARHQQGERRAAVADRDGVQLLGGCQQASGKCLQRRQQGTVELGFALAADIGVDRAGLGDEAAPAEGDGIAVILSGKQGAQDACEILARGGARLKRLDQGMQSRQRCKIGAKTHPDRIGRQVRRDAEEGGDTSLDSVRFAGTAVFIAEQGALAQRLLEHGLETVLRREPRQQVERTRLRPIRLGRDVSEQFTARRAQHLGLREIIGDLEARRHIGLEGRRLQDARAEGVDGLDAQPARRFQGLCEKPARLGALGRGRRLAGQSRQLTPQRLIRKRRPVAQRLEDAVRHVGGRGLGIGDAEHPAGRDIVEQQPEHAIDQHMGLTRAGIGRDPGGEAWIGGLSLALIGQRRNDPAGLHASPPSSPPGAADHSLTRARWS